MIKINLLGDDTVIDQSGRLILVGYVGSLILCFAVFFLLQTSITSRIGSLSAEVEDKEARLAQLKKTTEKVRELEKRRAELNSITATIAKLRLSQQGPVRVMDDLNGAIPGKAWLREVDEKGGMMKVTGLALNDHEIVALLKNLQASNYFESVDLVESVSVYLVKVTAYNHFTSKFTRFVVRAEEKLLQLKKIQAEAKKNGLKFQSTQGPPSQISKGGDVRVMKTGDIGATARSGATKQGVFKSGSSRVEKISAWSSVEPVPGKAFTIMARVAYAGRLKALLDSGPVVEQVATVDKKAMADLNGSYRR